jgi:hypothetical protein
MFVDSTSLREMPQVRRGEQAHGDVTHRIMTRLPDIHSSEFPYGCLPITYPCVARRLPDISYAATGMSRTPDASIHAL